MAASSRHEITELLRAWSAGNQSAPEKLMPLVYDELRRRAHRYMARERPGHTLQTTALVNETYVRLVDSKQASWQDRVHFFAVCARLMRRILMDWARSRNSLKRLGGVRAVSLDEGLVLSKELSTELVALDDSLQALARLDRRKSEVVQLRFFGGLSVEETAQALNVSPETVMRDWKLAKVWLLREMSEKQKDEA